MDPVNQPINKINRKIIFAVFFAIFSSLLLGFSLGIILERKACQQTLLTAIQNKPQESSRVPVGVGHEDFKYQLHLKCPFYWHLERDQYLPTYTVKPGDTLLSIANNQLGDSNKVFTLIALNEKHIPELSMKNSFIETGWELYLPPDDLYDTYGDLRAFAGEISEISLAKNIMFIKSPNGTSPTLIESETQYPDGKNLKVGDCVVAFKELVGSERRFVQIRLQKSFKPLNQ